MHTYIHTYIHTYLRTYIHTHIHTYTYVVTCINKHAFMTYLARYCNYGSICIHLYIVLIIINISAGAFV